MVQWLRSLAFNAQMYAMMALMGVAFLPLALASARGARFACRTYCHWVRWTASWMIGLRTEIRGPVPQGPAIVAAKHQSFLDIILIFSVLPHPRFIMKRELVWAPILGQYALRLGCIPVNRGKGGAAVTKMVADALHGDADAGQLVIYPQGTRVAPGVDKPYKIGAAALYAALDQPCVPAATNAGLFWPRRGVLRKPGLAVVRFLPAIPPGRSKEAVLGDLRTQIEAASDALSAEAQHAAPDRPAG